MANETTGGDANQKAQTDRVMGGKPRDPMQRINGAWLLIQIAMSAGTFVAEDNIQRASELAGKALTIALDAAEALMPYPLPGPSGRAPVEPENRPK